FLCTTSRSKCSDNNNSYEVPTLTGESLDRPLTSSLKISYWLCQRYPHLLPREHEAQIRLRLAKMHDIQALSLSVPDKKAREYGVPNIAAEQLSTVGKIPEDYRSALQFKAEFHKKHMESALEADQVVLAESKVLEVFCEISDTYHEGDVWLFGQAVGPTILDAHLVPLITRLEDCGRQDLVPGILAAYAGRVRSTDAWREATHGRPTMWDISMGHVADMEL
ncbi:hypothetical protein CMEL01_14622, partial [Colletotrichum melonis]